jgi:septal ring factor EnvC (AmiA/AmiB activator)
MIHPLLERQLKKVGLEADTLPTDLDSWAALLERMSRVYAQSEQDRYLLERSLSLASEEMQQEIAERKRAEQELRQTHRDLERQNKQLERAHELLRSGLEQMMSLIRYGATADELLVNLRIVQAEFERLDKPKSNGK